MQKITPFLWFDTQAEEAAAFYSSIFPRSKIGEVTSMIVRFELDGQSFLALNGGPRFTFNEAISLFISCETQDEVDYYWERLGEGGEQRSCGWLKDKFGVSWQVIPTLLPKLLHSLDRDKAERTMQAMLQMRKIDIAALQKAYDG